MEKKSPKVIEIIVTRRLVVEEKKCPTCGKPFVGAKVKKFCSRPCLNKASYDKHAVARREHRREMYHAEKTAGRVGEKK